MNVNDVAKAWKESQAGVEPKWNEDEHAQANVDLAKQFREELKAVTGVDRGNENGMGRHDSDANTDTIYGVTHAG